MLLDASCHCGLVRFTVASAHPVPFQRCYCSICRKTAGSGGFAINLAADARTLAVVGREHTRVYRARLTAIDVQPVVESEAERVFCGTCGSPLWLWSPSWPDLLHPHASAIDTALPTPPEHTHLMLGSKPDWVEPAIARRDHAFDEFPELSIAEWHDRLGLTEGAEPSRARPAGNGPSR